PDIRPGSARSNELCIVQYGKMILYKGYHFGLFAIVRDKRNCLLLHQLIYDFRFMIFHFVDRNRQGLLGCVFSFSLTNRATIRLISSSFSLTIRSPRAINFWM